ncbi:MAG: hypothetical protein ACRCS3_15465, partial [Paracoccaceae bacterium]
MNLGFQAVIKGREIHCEITSDTALKAPDFCFSLMATPRVISGGTLVRCVAGYAEVALADIVPGEPLNVIIAHEKPDYRPRNRAWLPLGAFLRVGGRTYALPELPAGVRGGEEGAPVALPGGRLPLIPQPERWEPSGGRVAVQAIT